MDEPRMEKVQVNDIRPGCIPHESLSHDFREQIEAVYRLIGRYLRQTLEEFKIGFMRDSRPEDEVAIWCRIATAWYEYHDRLLGSDFLSDDQEKKIVAALIAISLGREVERTGVSAEMGERLTACYEQTGRE
jgi:hypothetical protein